MEGGLIFALALIIPAAILFIALSIMFLFIAWWEWRRKRIAVKTKQGVDARQDRIRHYASSLGGVVHK